MANDHQVEQVPVLQIIFGAIARWPRSTISLVCFAVPPGQGPRAMGQVRSPADQAASALEFAETKKTRHSSRAR